MDFDVSDEVLLARGKYTTLSARQKELGKEAQELTQGAADSVRQALYLMDESSNYHLTNVGSMLRHLALVYDEINELKHQKEELRPIAWPK